MNAPVSPATVRATAPAPSPAQVHSIPPAPASGIHLVHSAAPVVIRDKLIRMPQVEDLTGQKKSWIYAKIKAHTFPPPVVLSRRCSVWSEAAVLTWIQARITEAEAARQEAA